MNTSSTTPSAPPALVVVGASAGGVEAARTLVAGLPADLPAAVLATIHVPAIATSALPLILDRDGPLPARHAQDGEPLRAGEVLVAPPDHHLVVLGDRVGLTHGPAENGHRPAVDVLFRSAARSWGRRVTAVVLSGALDDGAAGVAAVAQRGGRFVVQTDALFTGMPEAAGRAASPDARLPVAAIAARLDQWVRDLPRHEEPPTRSMREETAMAELDPETLHRAERPGEPAGLGCPDCAGALFHLRDHGMDRFRCRVGHAWSPESLLVRLGTAHESALWMALRSLEEKAVLSEHLGRRAAADANPRSRSRFDQGAAEAREAAELVRELIEHLGAPPGPGDGSEGIGPGGGRGT